MKNISLYKIIFWDFDGVIKESTAAKTKAYVDLFKSYGAEVQSKVQQHHLQNGGISRFVKIPYYFETFAGKKLSPKEEQLELERYRKMTLDAVVDSMWVPGAIEYIQNQYMHQDFYIVTGTPQDDINIICERLDLKKYFKGIFGAPETKTKIVARVIEKNHSDKNKFLFIGDALADFEASQKNEIDFLLRQTQDNLALFAGVDVERINDFTEMNILQINTKEVEK